MTLTQCCDTGSAGVISHRNDPRIRRIRNFQFREERQRTGLFFAEGIRFLIQAVENHAHIETLIAAPALLENAAAHRLFRKHRRAGTPCLEVTAEVFHSISQADEPQGIGAVLRQRWETLDRAHLTGETCWVALESVQSPGNLGTILRTCDAVGAAGAILLGPTTDAYDPATVRASMGAIFSQRLIRTTLEELRTWKARHGCSLVGTSPTGRSDYRSVTYRHPVILLMGCEQQGLTVEQQTMCDTMVRIPMVGRSDSLNLGVATGIMLYEVFNQRRSKALRKAVG